MAFNGKEETKRKRKRERETDGREEDVHGTDPLMKRGWPTGVFDFQASDGSTLMNRINRGN